MSDNEIRDTLIGLVIIIAMGLIWLNIAALVTSAAAPKKCSEPNTRWIYLVPAYHLGCWMSEEVKP